MLDLMRLLLNMNGLSCESKFTCQIGCAFFALLTESSWPDDAMRVAPMGSETGAFASMVISYWEQACALLNYDLLHEDLFFDTSGEFFGVWELVKPVVPAFRERFVAKTFCTNLEKAAQRYEKWIEGRSPGHIAAMREFMKQMSAQLAKAA